MSLYDFLVDAHAFTFFVQNINKSPASLRDGRSPISIDNNV